MDQLKFMDERIAKHDALGLINGPTGTGKSTSAFLKALMLATVDQKIVLWVHVDTYVTSQLSLQVVRLYGSERQVCESTGQSKKSLKISQYFISSGSAPPGKTLRVVTALSNTCLRGSAYESKSPRGV